MKQNKWDISQRSVALIAGITLLIMTVVAGFAYGYVFEGILVPDNATETSKKLKDLAMLFRLGIVGWVVIFIADVLVAWALYIFLKKVNQSLSLLVAWLRLMYTAVLGVAILNLVLVLQFPATGQTSDLVLGFMNAFHSIWSIGLIVFGGHLILLGYLVWNANYVPKVWSVLLTIAGVCYMGTSVAQVLMGDYQLYKAAIDRVVSLPMIAGELGLAIWLVIKGGKQVKQPAIVTG